jgi:hypothetical protein
VPEDKKEHLGDLLYIILKRIVDKHSLKMEKKKKNCLREQFLVRLCDIACDVTTGNFKIHISF